KFKLLKILFLSPILKSLFPLFHLINPVGASMTVSFEKLVLFIVITVLSISPLAYAKAWPVFSSPNQSFLLQNGYIDTLHCPPGQGKLSANARIQIQTFCK